MRLYLAASPAELPEALKWGLPIAHLAYRMAGGVLLRDAAFDAVGGMMALRVSGEASADVAGDVLRECRVRSFGGVLLESSDGSPLGPFAEALGAKLPLRYGRGGRSYGAFMPTDVYKESFAAWVRERAGKKPYRATADLSVGYRLYSPPCPEGKFERLARSEAVKLLGQAGRSFFSEKLCVNYAVVSSGGKPRFLLFDTPESVAAKIRALKAAGIESAVLLYSENTPETLRAAIAAAGK
ncbi:MAG: hypothetical protein J6P71_02720 [Oscillospiraceae bacterium]|nr:hypothetical protein [Oscillospiraceae bacterium]